MISKRDLEELLNIKKRDFLINVRNSNTGPTGSMEGWKLLNRRKDIWKHIEPLTAGASKKIIFSEPFEGKKAANPFVLSFVASLIKHFEVFLWYGANKPVFDARPLASPEEFWQFKPTACAATAEQVKYTLAHQGVNADQFIIIDHEYYGSIVETWLHNPTMMDNQLQWREARKLERIKSWMLDLKEKPFSQFDEYAKQVNALQITTIYVYPLTKQEINHLIQLFPKLDTLIIKHATADWINKTLDTNFGLSIEIRGIYDEKLILSENISVGNLTISTSFSNLKEFSAAKGARVTRLTLQYFTKINIENLGGLVHLGLDYCNVASLTVARKNQIESLHINDCFVLTGYSFKSFPALKHLKFTGSSNGRYLQIDKFNSAIELLLKIGIDLRGKPPKLETVELGKMPDQGNYIDLSRVTTLRELKVYNSSNWNITYPAHDFVNIEVTPAKDNRKFNNSSDYVAWTENGERIDKFESTLDRQDIRIIHDMQEALVKLVSENLHLDSVNHRNNIPTRVAVAAMSPNTKIFKVNDEHVIASLYFDFTNKHQLTVVDIHTPKSTKTNVDVKNCGNLLHLSINTGKNPLHLENIGDCPDLRTLTIRSSNADLIRQVVEARLPDNCVIFTYKEIPDDIHYSPSQSSSCSSLMCAPPSCSACSSGSAPADEPESSNNNYCPTACGTCNTCLSCLGVTPFTCGRTNSCSFICNMLSCGFVTASALGSIIFIAVIMHLRVSVTPPPYTQTTTTLNLPTYPPITTTPAANTGASLLLPFLISSSSLSGLMLLITGILIYRFRRELGFNFTRQDALYDLNLFGAARLDEASLFHGVDVKFNDRFKYNFHTGQRVDYDHMRLHVHNKMTRKNGNIFFHTDLTGMRRINVQQKLLDYHVKKHIGELMVEVRRAQNECIAYIEGDIRQGEIYPLPSLESVEHPDDLLNIYADAIDVVNFYYLPSTQQYYFALSDQTPRSESTFVLFFYQMKRNINFLRITYPEDSAGREHITADQVVMMQDPATLLPSSVLQFMRNRLNNFEPLMFLFDESITINERLNRLIDYVRSGTGIEYFKNRHNHLELLAEMAMEKKGVCRHVSMYMFTLARMIGVPVDINVNRGQRNIGHRFVAIPFVTDSGIRYQRVDLSLPDNADELTADYADIFAKIDRDLNLLLVDIPVEIAMADSSSDFEAQQAVYHNYYSQFQQALSVENLFSVQKLLDTSLPRFSPLILLKPDQIALDVNDEIARQLASRKNKISHMYVDTPEDFITYLEPDQIIGGRQITNKNGPLKINLTDHDNINMLVINWSNFTPGQIAAFQTTIDSPPYLSVDDIHLPLPPNVVVVGLIRDIDAAGKAFISRTKRYVLTEDFFKKQEHSNESAMETTDRVIIDLFSCPTWLEPVFGEIVYQGKDTLLYPGALNRAIARRCPLIINNPPSDPEFTQFVHQVNGERKVLHNGVMIDITGEVKIILENKEHTETASNINLKAESSTEQDNRQRIYISINNLHEIYKQLHIDDHHQAETIVGGLLKRYDAKKQVFYLIGDIPKSYWQAFVAHVKEQYSETDIDFILSSNARIEGIQEAGVEIKTTNVPFQTLHSDFGNMLACNDPDYVAEHLSAMINDSVIIHVTAQTTFSELIASIKHDEIHNTGFLYHEYAVLSALKNSKTTIIMCGELSLTLYYQLQSLLSNDPHICLNGKRQTVQGRLIAVMPSLCISTLPGITHECHLKSADYSAIFQRDPDFNPEHLNIIKLFYNKIRKLPHRGPGRPPKPVKNYQHLKMLLNALNEQQSMYEHNPIKGWVSYHYPRHSEDQAFINVMAKFYFSSQDMTPPRLDKLKSLMTKFSLNDEINLQLHLWKVLNCFHGAELNRLLGSHLEGVVFERGYPTINKILLDKLKDICQETLQLDIPVRLHIPRTEKQLHRLREAIKNPHITTIFLKGDPGIGKTYTVRKLIGKYYEGEEGLLEFLSMQDQGADIIYLWDEGNNTKPGTMDFLIKGLASRNRTVTYKGITHKLSRRHKLFITGNPEKFPGRYFHQAILDYAFVIYFDLPDDAFMLKLSCNILPAHLHKFAEIILHSFHQIKLYNPFFVTSIRDIENLTHRFAYLAKDIPAHKEQDLLQAIFTACTTEFAGSILEKADREKFIAAMRSNIGIQQCREPLSLIRLTDTVSMPPQKAYIVKAIEQNLDIRLQALMQEALRKNFVGMHAYRLFNDNNNITVSDENIQISHKQSNILQGEPGLGKSTLLRAIVHKYKNSLVDRKRRIEGMPHSREKMIMLSVIETEMNKPVYEISVGSADAAITLQRAFHEEAITIGDESNIDPKLEHTLNDFISGVDEHKNPINKTGFMFLGSQNSSAHAGRNDESPATRNRSHFIYFDPLTRQEYQLFAEDANILYPDQFVRAFYDARRVFPTANPRTFHQVLKSVKAEQLLKLAEAPQNGPDSGDVILDFSDSNSDQESVPLRRLAYG